MKRHTLIHWAVAAVFLVGCAAPLAAGKPTRQKPTLPEPQAYVPKALISTKLSNGIQVHYYEKPGLPLVSMTTWVSGGRAGEAQGQEGLLDLFAAMLDEGSGGRSALAFAEEVDFLGADLGVSSSDHGIRISLDTTLEHFDAATALYRDLIRKPNFAQEELDRTKKRLHSSILQSYDEPGQVGSIVFWRAIYGESHPYGRNIGQHWSRIKQYTRDDLHTYHQQTFQSQNMAIVVAGAIDHKRLMARLEVLFGSIPAGKQSSSKKWKRPKETTRGLVLVDKPGAAQSVLRLGHQGIAVGSRDYYAVQVMNTILGGSFASRLNQNIREEHGYAYYARSSFVSRQDVGPFIASSNVQTNATDKAISEFFKEFDRIGKDISAADVSRAKNYLMLRFPNSFADVSAIVGLYVDLLEEGKPLETPREFAKNIERVSLADVQRVAKSSIHPDQMVVVVVGDRAAVESGIRKLNLGEVTVSTIEEALGQKPKMD